MCNKALQELLQNASKPIFYFLNNLHANAKLFRFFFLLCEIRNLNIPILSCFCNGIGSAIRRDYAEEFLSFKNLCNLSY